MAGKRCHLVVDDKTPSVFGIAVFFKMIAFISRISLQNCAVRIIALSYSLLFPYLTKIATTIAEVKKSTNSGS